MSLLALRRPRVLVILIASLFAAVALGFSTYFLHGPRPSAEVEPFFSGLGPHTRKITTASPVAQRYFNQGLALLFGFNYDEAIRSFEAAADCDPKCAMAYWGVAVASNQYLSNPSFDEARVQAARRALGRARSLAEDAAPVEQSLIEALSQRYADPPPRDRLPLDRAYYAAMRRVWMEYPKDGDVGALTAQALMLRQREGQRPPDGTPTPDGDELIRTLNTVLARNPGHPFAMHLLIHAVEASSHPEWGDAAADRVRDYAPGLAHLTHMPSHIDVRRGRWQEAVVACEKAIAADKAYQQIVTRRGGTYWTLMAHNHHMLAYAAAMQGESRKATQTIQEMIADYFSGEVPKNYPLTVDGFLAMPYELHLRFGRWEAMLAEPPPQASFPLATALWHFARGVAFAAKHEVASAKSESASFSDAKKAVPPGEPFRYTPAIDLLDVAERMLVGEILFREGKVDEGIAALRAAAEREDKLPYSEPPDWFQPVRHALGAVLLDVGRFAEAEAVYREDLVRHPENGWSLFGLSQSLRKQKKNAEADAVTVRFKKVWQQADIKLTASCLCVPGKE